MLPQIHIHKDAFGVFCPKYHTHVPLVGPVFMGLKSHCDCVTFLIFCKKKESKKRTLNTLQIANYNYLNQVFNCSKLFCPKAKISFNNKSQGIHFGDERKSRRYHWKTITRTQKNM